MDIDNPLTSLYGEDFLLTVMAVTLVSLYHIKCISFAFTSKIICEMALYAKHYAVLDEKKSKIGQTD